MEIQAAILLVIVFFLMLAFSVSVSYSIIVSALVTIVAFLTPGFGVFVSAQKMVSGIDSFSLIAVPFFILAGLLMNSGGIAKRLINLALLVLGKVPGSLALTNIAGNAMFGSISGSGIAAATAIGGVMLPLEKEQKYDPAYAAAANIASAPTGLLIPPTSAFIVYSTVAGGVSISTLFIAMAPSLGFLGTVIGMVMAFDKIQQAGDISPTVVAGGMKVALITTIFGLVVALILQVFYNYILSKIEGLTSEMEDSSITLLDMITKYNLKYKK